MRIPNPIATTTTEAYLAYKAGVLAQADLKEKLYHPYIHIDGWLAYWTGLTDTYPTDKNGDPECLTDEEAYIAYLAGVTSEYPEALKDPADPRMAGYLKYLISARFGRPNYPVTREELYLSMMKPPVVPSGDPSSSIDLEGTIEYPFISMEMYGDTSQKSYSGKNLLKINAGTRTSGGISWTITEELLSGSGTATNTSSLLINTTTLPASLPAGSYTFSVQSAISDYRIQFIPVESDNTMHTYEILPGTTSISFTTDYVATSYRLGVFGWRAGDVISLSIDRPMLETGSTATSYEPFVGGITAPNPDYPQAVQTVTGRQMVAVTGGDGESAEYEINLGKNLRPNLGITGAAAVYRMNNALYYKLSKGTYTVSFKTTNTTANIRPLFYIQDMQRQEITSGSVFAVSDGFTYQNNGWGKSSGRYLEQTFTLLNDYYVQVVLVNYNSSVYTASDMQIEKGSTATDYAPYFDPIELCKIGDYQDYIYRDGEDWHVHKETSKLVFDGSDDEQWGYANNGNFYCDANLYSGGLLPENDNGYVQMYCNAYISETYRKSWINHTNYTVTARYDGNSNPRINNQDYTSVNDFKAYLASNNVILHYPLATPTDTQITNSALIAQLDALMEGGSYDGETHIRISAVDPNLPALLKVEAAK